MSDSVPTSRTYVHTACEMETEIDDSDFEAIADPISRSSSLMCAHCEDVFPIDDFAWADTGELIVAYYERHSLNVGAVARVLGSRALGIVFAVVGLAGGGVLAIPAAASIGWMGGTLVGLVCGVIGACAGLLVWDAVLKPAIARRAFGVADCRSLI